jgi:hypothetical protein
MAALLASFGAQAQTPAGPLTAVQPTPTADAGLQSATEQVKANVTALSQFEVPMSTEPAFEFKA